MKKIEPLMYVIAGANLVCTFIVKPEFISSISEINYANLIAVIWIFISLYLWRPK